MEMTTSLVDVMSHNGLGMVILGCVEDPRVVVRVQACCKALQQVLRSREGDEVWRRLYECRWGSVSGDTPPRPAVHGRGSSGYFMYVRSWREAYRERLRGVLDMAEEAVAMAVAEVVDTPRAKMAWSQVPGPRSYVKGSTGCGISRACRAVDKWWSAEGQLPLRDVVYGLLAPGRPWVANVVGVQQALKRHGARRALAAVEDGVRGGEPCELAATGEVLSVRWWTIGELPHTRHQGGFRGRDLHHQVAGPLRELLRAAVRAEEIAEERPGLSKETACAFAVSETPGLVCTSGADFLEMWRVLERGARHEVRRIEVAVGSVTHDETGFGGR